jgi:uncharacterized protein YhaN
VAEGQGEVPLEGHDVVSPLEIAALAGSQLESLAAELSALDEPGVRAAEREAQRAAGMAEADLQRALGDAAALASEATVLAAALGHTVAEAELPTGEPAVVAARLLEVCPETAGKHPPREEIEEQLRALEQRVGRLEQARQDAVAALGKDEPVSPEAAQATVEELERDFAARRCAVEMVTATRRRMIDKVLPDTIHNTCILLPELTAGRYRYASLTPDYRLQVWDERKRDYVEKSLFSGGTQDQFSLALRLGFALAALPRELGTSPGFLFLDEPLSSFDRDRTAALVSLLTHGQIATFFQQVFLISHSQSFDPGLFTHHIVMEEGRVAESTLPASSQ